MMPLSEALARCAEGFRSVQPPVAAALQAEALGAVQRWLSEPRFRSYALQLDALIEDGRWKTILDSFCRVLPFGTGGRRGRVGIGPNRFNGWTLGTSVEGHARWLRARFPGAALRVAIGCDVRCFHDLDGELVETAPAPVRGLSSRDFAELAAVIYTAAGIRVWLPPAGGALSTPELSFAVRHLGCHGGLVISASHNPPDDNGCKIYDHTGAQLVPPTDEELAAVVDAVDAVDRMSLDRARAAGLVEELGELVHEAYIRANLAISRRPEARALPIVCTALHGTGRRTVYPVLRAAGFPVVLEPTQAAPDGRFPTVPLRAPNPERPAVLDVAIAHAEQVGADMVLATDPDADRLGVAVRAARPDPGATDPGRWRFFTGDELAVLACHAALVDRPPTSGRPPVVLKTEVTSSQLTRVAEAHGARVIGHLMVGFKYIGEAMALAETTGRFAGAPLALEDVVLGAEESHGLLATTAIRDKDAAGGALLLAELAAAERARGRTLLDVLEGLQERVGLVANLLVSTVMRGVLGRERIAAIQASLRHSPPARIGDRAVVAMEDRQADRPPLGPLRSQTDAASRDVLVFRLEGGARVVLRPSGTEPKNKVYIEIPGEPGAPLGTERRRLQRALRALADDVLALCLDRIGIALPAWALRCGEALSIDDRITLVDELLPAVAARRETDPAAAAAALRQGLRQLHPAAARLVRPALRREARVTGDPEAAWLLAQLDTPTG